MFKYFLKVKCPVLREHNILEKNDIENTPISFTCCILCQSYE